jgi:uncharacterized protein (DUF1810 family)/Flp pilus assembly protein TadB
MCSNSSSRSISPPNFTTTSITNKSNDQGDSSEAPVGSWDGRSVTATKGKSYTSRSNDDQQYNTEFDNSQSDLTTTATLNNNTVDDDTDLDAINLDIKGKSVSSKIRDFISKKVTIKKLLFVSIPIIAGLIITVVAGVGFPLLMGIGVAAIYFMGAALAKYVSKAGPETPEISERRAALQKIQEEYNETEKVLVKHKIKEEAQLIEITTKNDEVDKDKIDKDKKEIQDPSTLSTWQKIQQKLKLAAPFILGASIVALGIAATVATAGIPAIIAVSIASILGALCIAKGTTQVLDYIDEKQAFLDSQNLDDQKDYVDALDQIDNEDEIFEDALEQIDNEDEVFEDALEQIDNEDEVFEDALTEAELNKITQETKARRNRYDLTRFREAHEGKGAFRITYDEAIHELRIGKKEKHWIWYIFPQSESLSKTANSKLYGLKSQEEALEYLLDDDLGPKLVECTEAVLEHKDKSCQDIFRSHLDNKKFHSCMELFNATLQNYIKNGNKLPIWLRSDTEIFSKGLNKQ